VTGETAEQQAYNTTHRKHNATSRWVFLIMTEGHDKGHKLAQKFCQSDLQGAQSISTTKDSQLMLFREITDIPARVVLDVKNPCVCKM
jgi:hypothetical protein